MPSNDFTVRHEIAPRFRDTDAMGHINNAVYITYLEIGRQVYWAALEGRNDYRRVPFILANVTCDFRSEALVDERLEIGVRCDWIGTKSFGFRYALRSLAADRVVVQATTVMVCYDYAVKRSMPMPDELRARLTAFEGRPLARGPGA